MLCNRECKKIYKCILLFCILLFAKKDFLQATKYKLCQVDYEIDGKTKVYPLTRNVPISLMTFDTKESYIAYFHNILQQLQNQRVFESAIIKENIIASENEEDTFLISWQIIAKDTKNFIMLPYPKYDSNTGISIKLVARDYNFLGSMNPLSFDAKVGWEKDADNDEADEKHIVTGAGVSFVLPFKLGAFNSAWSNNFSFDYTKGDDHVNFGAVTALMFSLPFSNFSLQLDMAQGAFYDDDYEYYDDAMFGVSTVQLSMPITVASIQNCCDIIYAPYIKSNFCYDKNGISDLDPDLTSPRYFVGHSLWGGRFDWHENFRRGFMAEIDQYMYYDVQLDKIVPHVSGEAAGLFYFGIFNPSIRLYATAYMGGSEKIGRRLRGIADNQKYKIDKNIDSEDIWYLSGVKALNAEAAFVINCDCKVRVLRTHWDEWGYFIFTNILQPMFHLSCHPKLPLLVDLIFSVPKKLSHYCDFELQLAPFFDFGLCTNLKTHGNLDYKDGYYAGGIEALIYPTRYRSIVVRGSIGWDLGRKFFSDNLNMEFRKSNISTREIYVGLGLFY